MTCLSARGSGLVEARSILGSVSGLAFCHFNEQDVVRHHLVRLIIKAYQDHESELVPKATGMARKQKIRLGILFGGRSGEHEVSLTSAASVIAALDPAEFEISAIGITKEGRIATGSQVRQMLPAHISSRVDTSTALVARDSRIRLTSASTRNSNSSHQPPDIVFPLLHGPYGEDGTIQGLLETAGVPYIGCGVLASAVGMDKEIMKRLFLQDGLPVLPFLAVKTRDLPKGVRSLPRLVRSHLGYPVFSKPANLGSSVGVCKIRSEKELLKSVAYSAQFDRKVLIEKGIKCRELECAILGNDDPQASLVGEVIPSREFYDYEAKYHDPASRLEIPARITREESEKIRAPGVEGLSQHRGVGTRSGRFLHGARYEKDLDQ